MGGASRESGEVFISVTVRFKRAAGLDPTMLSVTFYFCWSPSSRSDCGQSIHHSPSQSPARFSVLCSVTSCHIHLNQRGSKIQAPQGRRSRTTCRQTERRAPPHHRLHSDLFHRPLSPAHPEQRRRKNLHLHTFISIQQRAARPQGIRGICWIV